MLLLVLALGKPFFIGIPGAEKVYHFLTNSKLAVYIAISWAWIVVLCFWQSKELKDQMYHRETFDLQEKKGILKVGADQTPVQYVFTTSKRMEVPTKRIIFVPDSYNNITLDAEGNISKYDAKEGWKKTYNMGAYEELSDALVRAGFATVRFAREKGEKNLVMDPYYDDELVDEIRAVEEGKIEYHYYQDTDFTLRFRRKNARNIEV